MLNFQKYCVQMYCHFLLVRCEELLPCKSASHFLAKNIGTKDIGILDVMFAFILNKHLTNYSEL